MEDYTSCRTFMMVDTQNAIYIARSSSCHTVGQVVLATTEAVHCSFISLTLFFPSSSARVL